VAALISSIAAAVTRPSVAPERRARPAPAPAWLSLDDTVMPRLMLNDVEQPLETMPDSWGELLDRLDRDADGSGHVVSVVRFDGVDEPTFRGDVEVRRTVAGIDLIEVETVPFRTVIDDALSKGAPAAASLAAGAIEIAKAFRQTEVDDAHRRLAELGEGIRAMTSMLALGADRLSVALDSLQWNGRTVPDQLTELVRLLESLAQAQTSRDWLTVADILEYDLEPTLATWGPVFEDLRSRIAPAS
jgi:hypothetical protein